jgi:hypothetical protein
MPESGRVVFCTSFSGGQVIGVRLLVGNRSVSYFKLLQVTIHGAGLRVPHDAVREGFESRLDEIALDSEYREAAQRIAKKNQYPTSEEPLKRIIAQLERLLDK